MNWSIECETNDNLPVLKVLKDLKRLYGLMLSLLYLYLAMIMSHTRLRRLGWAAGELKI